MNRLLLLLIGLTGCGTLGHSSVGQWSGICTLDDMGDAVGFELDVYEEEKGEVRGEGLFVYNNYEFAGKVRGFRMDKEIELELEGSSAGIATRLEIYGDIMGNAIRGECSLYGVSGSLQMSR